MRFALDAQQRDFAASIAAALAATPIPGGVPAAVRAWAAGEVGPGRVVWSSLAALGVTALAVPERCNGLQAHPVDLVVALEQLGRWCVPGPVTESLVVAPILLSDDPRCAELCGALAAGDLMATVALPPQVPRAVDADAVDLVLVADAGQVYPAKMGQCHQSVDPSRRLFDVVATEQPGQAWHAQVAQAYDFGVLATAAQLVGASQALLEMTVDYAKARSQFGRLIGSYQAIKHRLADVHIAVELARPLVYGAAVSLAAHSADSARDVSAAKAAASDAAVVAARTALQTHGAIGFTAEHDLSLWLLRVQALRPAWGSPALHRRRVLEALCAP
ncbi:MAG: acyl-CoA dehydrogenase family protein [Mycobacteriaceae bacterium]|nr:acyl-CoA dehydrogenase family protein [Mycobacteriaceae bacterium]